MRIIISPAKKMKTDTDTLDYQQLPQFVKETEELLAYLRKLSYEEIKAVWNCNDKIAARNYERIRNMDLYRNLTPAILAFEGIQYQYMAPAVFQTPEFTYLEKHLRILSGFYGMLRPFDGVAPDGRKVSLSDFYGKKAVLYFCSKDNTPCSPGNKFAPFYFICVKY